MPDDTRSRWKRLLTIGLGMAIALLVAWAVLRPTAWRQTPSRYAPPQRGDTLVYVMLFDAHGAIRTCVIRVRCLRTSETRSMLQVSYLMRNGQLVSVPWQEWRPPASQGPGQGQLWKPAYTVDIRYRTRKYQERVTVRDPQGKAIPRTQTVLGVPVPFHNLLFFPGDRIPRQHATCKIDDGWEFRNLGSSIFSPTTEDFPLLFSLHKWDGRSSKAIGYLERQWWDPGKWLWTKVVRESDTPGDPRFELVRYDVLKREE